MNPTASLRSPILLFEQQIAGSAFAVAPERENELRDVVPEFSLALSNDKGFNIRVNMSTHEATLPVATLEYMWSCAHLFWVLYAEYTEAQRRGDDQFDLSASKSCSDALELFNWTRSNQASSGEGEWPEDLPRPSREDVGNTSASNELFLVAVAWIIHHEISHVSAKHVRLHRIYAIGQEVEADQMAIDRILGECNDPAQRKKRQLGMVVALLAMQLLDELPGADTYVGSHPPTVERIFACLDRAIVDLDGAPRALAALVLQLQLSQFDVPIPLDGESIDDILTSALIAFRTTDRPP